MKTYGGSECIDPRFLDLGTRVSFTPGERASGTHWTGGWVGPRDSLNNVEKTLLVVQTGSGTHPASYRSIYVLRIKDAEIRETHYDNHVLRHTLRMRGTFLIKLFIHCDRLCGLVVRVPGHTFRGSGFDSRRYQIF
jgi:hypothetical protein